MIINGCRWQNHGQNHGQNHEQNYMATFWDFRKWHAIKLKRWGRGKRASITLVLKEGSRLGRILKDPTCSKAGGLITDSGWENLLRNNMPFCEVVSFCRQDFLSIYPFFFCSFARREKNWVPKSCSTPNKIVLESYKPQIGCLWSTSTAGSEDSTLQDPGRRGFPSAVEPHWQKQQEHRTCI